MKILPRWSGVRTVILVMPIKTLMTNYLVGTISLLIVRRQMLKDRLIGQDLINNKLLVTSLATAMLAEFLWILSTVLLFAFCKRIIIDHKNIEEFLEKSQKLSGESGEAWKDNLIRKTNEWNNRNKIRTPQRITTILVAALSILLLVVSCVFLIRAVSALLYDVFRSLLIALNKL